MKRIVVFGFGSQGKAQAQNLKESGKEVIVCLRKGSPSIRKARRAGLPVVTDAITAAKMADVASLLIPDREQPTLWRDILVPHLREKTSVVFAHGFNLHYRCIIPHREIDMLLVAPMAEGNAVRTNYIERKKTPCLIAIAHDATGKAHQTARAYARAISLGPFISTSVAEEVETDLFAEQTVLCGGIPALIRNAFEVLVKKGYNPDVAYLCCLHEMSWLGPLLAAHGIKGLEERISDVARFGAARVGPRIVTKETRRVMTKTLHEIQNGSFVKALSAETPRKTRGTSNHLLEAIHRKFG